MAKAATAVPVDDGASLPALLPEPDNLPALYASPEAMNEVLIDIYSKVRSVTPDTSTLKGRKAIASLAHAVARSKTALDDAGKADRKSVV